MAAKDRNKSPQRRREVRSVEERKGKKEKAGQDGPFNHSCYEGISQSRKQPASCSLRGTSFEEACKQTILLQLA
jgi:hypothetical protein